MLHIEIFSKNSNVYTWLTNHFPFLVDERKVDTFAIAWFFKENGVWVKKPRLVPAIWQYINAIFSVRTNIEFFIWLALQIAFFYYVSGWWLLMFIPFTIINLLAFALFPFAFFFQFRWSDDPTDKKQYQQLGIGWKESGRFAIHYRRLSDASSQAGYHEGMPNIGQAQGFNYGQK